MRPSAKTEASRRSMHKDHDCRECHLGETQPTWDVEDSVHSPFFLRIPELQSRSSSVEAMYLDEQTRRDLDEKPEQNVLNVKSTYLNAATRAGRRVPKPIRKSRNGHPYPSFPPGVTKKIASNFARPLGSKSTTIDQGTLDAIAEATDRYFEQISKDLGILAGHAGRQKIGESDVVAAMRR